jgi:NDP-sugar pyrophosphorylase family protein
MKAIILAGGSGTRLWGPGAVLPKCLLPVYDRPLVLYQLEHCALAGGTEVLISVAARFEPLVMGALRRAAIPRGLSVRCIAEEVPLGPVGGLIALQPLIGRESVLVVLGDVYFEYQQGFQHLHRRQNFEGIDLGVVRRSRADRILCNVIMDAADRVLRLREKPLRHQIVGDVRWCGVTRFGPGAFAAIPPKAASELLLGDMLELVRAEGVPLSGVDFDEVEINLNTPESVMLASCVEARRRYATTARVPGSQSELLRDLVTVASDLYKCSQERQPTIFDRPHAIRQPNVPANEVVASADSA